ncbi:MAG: FAD-dependent oxidoreductase [Lentisphaeria bacterium]|nr:FAD-dependent oxidoreductase [Lentisphaeria bacterium]NQZ68911.1 FAD-dependent oxidoreductase [Lentisphaeria bacterium]
MNNPFQKAIDSLKIEYDKAPNPQEHSTFTGLGTMELDHSTIAKDIPCQSACPAKTNVPAYIEALAQGDPDKAYLINQEDNVFSGVLGRICSRPCQDACRHQWTNTNGPVQICHLKRSASDYKTNPPKPLDAWFETSGKSVAVIGGGPAGLTAARELVRYGHKVTIYEREAYLGGMMMQGIPVFRLPRDVVEAEVKAIIDSGIDVEFNCAVDGAAMAEITEKFDAVVVTVGHMKPYELDVEGADINTEGVVSGLEFMKDYNFDQVEEMTGQDVIIIGGGFTAVDCARSCARAAKRMVGADGTVAIVYRRTEGQMTGDHDEIQQMVREGIEIDTLLSPVGAVTDNGKITHLTVRRNILDEEKSTTGKPAIKAIEGSDRDYPCNMLIVAIGQDKEDDILPEGVKQTENNWTSNEKIFLGGDYNYGSLDVITAVNDGKNAAKAADTFIMGEERMQTHVGITLIDSNGETGRVRDHDNQLPVEMPKLPLSERDGTNEVELGHNAEGTQVHATRCYFCHYKFEIDQDKCIHCDWCIQVSPRSCIHRISRLFHDKDGAVKTETSANTAEDATFIWIESDECIRCGKCLRICPTGAITMRKTELTNCKVSELKSKIAENKDYGN